VVGRTEARVQRVRAAGCQRCDSLRVHARCPLHDGMAFHIDATTTGTPGELGVLPRGDRDPGLAVELLHLLEYDRARWHVDSECQSLGGEDGLDELAPEKLLHDLFESRKHAGVVSGDTAFQALAPLPESEYIEVLILQGSCS